MKEQKTEIPWLTKTEEISIDFHVKMFNFKAE